ncbi:MAG: exodeoxyribonuclease VII small subunit [Oscillospiraceae bacterium]|nr:exodeoxyribonuclease VII small subunit [Oscillospiraceae bacterium]
MNYEELMKRIAEITRRLETEQLPLEEATKLYAEGMKLSAECHKFLEDAVLAVEQIPVPKQETGEAE